MKLLYAILQAADGFYKACHCLVHSFLGCICVLENCLSRLESCLQGRCALFVVYRKILFCPDVIQLLQLLPYHISVLVAYGIGFCLQSVLGCDHKGGHLINICRLDHGHRRVLICCEGNLRHLTVFQFYRVAVGRRIKALNGLSVHRHSRYLELTVFCRKLLVSAHLCDRQALLFRRFHADTDRAGTYRIKGEVAGLCS